MWGAAKAAGFIHKVADSEYRNWPTAPELLRWLTRGGARGMLDSDVAVTLDATRSESAGPEAQNEVRVQAALRF